MNVCFFFYYPTSVQKRKKDPGHSFGEISLKSFSSIINDVVYYLVLFLYSHDITGHIVLKKHINLYTLVFSGDIGGIWY